MLYQIYPIKSPLKHCPIKNELELVIVCFNICGFSIKVTCTFHASETMEKLSEFNTFQVFTLLM